MCPVRSGTYVSGRSYFTSSACQYFGRRLSFQHDDAGVLRLEDWIGEDNSVRAVDAFVEELDLVQLGFGRAVPAEIGCPAYHPADLLKIYIYGYLNRVPSSRRLEREAQRNIELMWLTGPLAPDFKTIADFRRDNDEAIREVCREFVELSRQIGLFGDTVIAIDGSKFKAVTTSFTSRDGTNTAVQPENPHRDA